MNKRGFLLADTILAMFIISIHVIFIVKLVELSYRDIQQSEEQYETIQDLREKQ